MSVRLELTLMKMIHSAEIPVPSNLENLKVAALAFVEKYFTSSNQTSPKQYGSLKYTFIKSNGVEVASDSVFQALLEKGHRTFQVHLQTPSI